MLGLDGGTDLAAQLAAAFGYPDDRPPDLARVSQYVATMNGSGPLYDELHRRFEEAAEPQPVHRFLAGLAPVLRARGAPHQLVISTRYDLALERAFDTAGRSSTSSRTSRPGRTAASSGTERPARSRGRSTCRTPTRRSSRSTGGRSSLKLHGAVDPFPDWEWESFVITEDDYIDYLGRSDLAAAVPVALAARSAPKPLPLPRVRDGGLEPPVSSCTASGATGRSPTGRGRVDPEPTALEQAFWRRFDVDVLAVDAGRVRRPPRARLEGVT